MDKNNSNKKILIIACCAMVLVAVVLIIVIVGINKNDKPENPVTDPAANNTDISSQPIVKDEIAPKATVVPAYSDPTEEITATSAPSDYTTSDDEEKIVVTLGEYEGIKVTCNPVVISDSDIDNLLNELKGEYSDIIDMPDRPFENGDMAVVTYEGRVDGQLIRELYAVCLQVILGRGVLPDDFEKEIIGRKKGDTFTISMDYPKDFTELPEVAGKTVVFDVSLVDGFIFYTPEIDDAFIKENTEYSTVDEYKTETKATLQKEQDDIAYKAAIKELKKKVIENATFAGPVDNEIKKQYVRSINELNNQYQEEYGIDAATYYQIFYGISPEEYTASVMEDAEIEVKYSYILQTIANEKGITVEEADKIILESAVIEGMER